MHPQPCYFGENPRVNALPTPNTSHECIHCHCHCHPGVNLGVLGCAESTAVVRIASSSEDWQWPRLPLHLSVSKGA